MATVHHHSFVDFASNGKSQRFGELFMAANEVFSYGVVIAKVDREKKHITFCSKKYSATTSTHQKAISLGFLLSLKNLGWTLTETQNVLS